MNGVTYKSFIINVLQLERFLDDSWLVSKIGCFNIYSFKFYVYQKPQKRSC